MVSSLEIWSSGMKSPSREFRKGVLFWRKSIIPIICWVELCDDIIIYSIEGKRGNA